MANDFIGVELDGLEEIQAKMAKLPNAIADEGADEGYKKLLNILHGYPPRKSVTRKEAYGVTFFSDKQRRAFFGKLKSGEISVPYQRTQNLSKSWKQEGEGRRSFLSNDVPYAKHLYDDDKQSRLAAKIGWKKLQDTLKEHSAEIVRKFDAGVKKAMRKVGL